MDARLSKTHGTRIATLKDDDLKELARAIVAFSYKQATASRGIENGVEYVVLRGKDFRVRVLASDWDLLMIDIKDGIFDDKFPKRLADTYYDSSLIGLHANPFYALVLNRLRLQFSKSYPTSKL